MTGNKFECAVQRVVGWCETLCVLEYNSSLSFQSKGVSRVELDGFSRYRETVLLDTVRVGGKITKQSGTAELKIFVSFMQK